MKSINLSSSNKPKNIIIKKLIPDNNPIVSKIIEPEIKLKYILLIIEPPKILPKSLKDIDTMLDNFPITFKGNNIKNGEK